ncbi:MAG: glycosyltransferase family 39 protein [Candidatus Sericytochromatia bacterium]
MEETELEAKEIKESFLIKKTKRILFVFLITLFVTQISFFIHAMSQSTDNWAIIFTKDNDAANAIRLSQVSDWVTNNRYYNYGNLYFRISNTISKINPFIKIDGTNVFSEQSDQTHHFILMLVSFLSMLGISFLISYILTNSKTKFLISSIIINSIFMSITYWIAKVLGVHPDLLLCFFVSLSIYYTAKYISLKDDKILYFSGILWGLTLAIKLSALFYMPTLLLLFINKPFKQDNIIKALKFFALIGLTFFIIGFPQNFEFNKIYEFVKYQSAFSIAPTMESFNEWWFLLYRQYIPFLPFIFIIALFLSSKNNIKMNKIELIKLFMISFIPFAFFLQRNITSPHEHYTLPVVAGLLIFTSILFINLKEYFSEQKKLDLDKNSLSISLIFTFLTVLILKLSPNVTNALLVKDLECRDESREVYKIVKTYQSQKLKTHVDPYVPFSQALGFVRNNWFKEMSDIAPNNADVLVLSKKYYIRFLGEETHYLKQDTNRFNEVKKFYQAFYNKKLVKDVYNQQWEKVAEYSCGFEIWLRRNNLTSQ